MNLAFIRCECGRHHLKGTPYCERCGNQPVTAFGRNTIPDMSAEEAPRFIDCCVALNEALKLTGGKWAVA